MRSSRSWFALRNMICAARASRLWLKFCQWHFRTHSRHVQKAQKKEEYRETDEQATWVEGKWAWYVATVLEAEIRCYPTSRTWHRNQASISQCMSWSSSLFSNSPLSAPRPCPLRFCQDELFLLLLELLRLQEEASDSRLLHRRIVIVGRRLNQEIAARTLTSLSSATNSGISSILFLFPSHTYFGTWYRNKLKKNDGFDATLKEDDCFFFSPSTPSSPLQPLNLVRPSSTLQPLNLSVRCPTLIATPTTQTCRFAVRPSSPFQPLNLVPIQNRLTSD